MLKEGLSLQFDMFSGELVDTRSNAQKKRDKECDTPQQIQMFKTPEMVQIGGKTKSAYRDWLNKTTAPPLVLQPVETRSPEEIERDLMREAEKQMTPLFVIEPSVEDTPDISTVQSVPQENQLQQRTIIFDAKMYHSQRGLRARLRAQNILVRRRSISL